MEIREYQRQALKTAIYPNRGSNLAYAALGLAGESGEVAEKVKKVIRDDNGVLTPATKEKLKKELGDVMWYVAVVCYEAGLDMDDVAEGNLAKLADRMERGVIGGQGDNR